MSPDERKQFENYFDMFASVGWKQLENDLEASIADINSVDGVDSEKELYRRQGKLETLRNLANLKSVMEVMYDQAEEEDADEDL